MRMVLILTTVILLATPASLAADSLDITWSCGQSVASGTGGIFGCNSGYQYIPAGSYSVSGDVDAALSTVGTYDLTLGSVAEVSCTIVLGTGLCTIDSGSGIAGSFHLSVRFNRVSCALNCPWSASITLSPS